MIHEFIEFIKFALPIAIGSTLVVFIFASIIVNKKAKQINPIYRAEIKKQNQKYINSLEHHRTI